MRRTRNNSGFTLVELVLVLLIITIVALVSVPTLSAFAKGRVVQDTAARFVAATHYARTQAISDGATYRLNIDVAGGRWWLSVDDGNTFVDVDSTIVPPYTVAEGVKLETNATVDDTTKVPAIEFDPQGRCDPVQLKIIGPTGDSTMVVCDTPIDTFHVVTPGGN